MSSFAVLLTHMESAVDQRIDQRIAHSEEEDGLHYLAQLQ